MTPDERRDVIFTGIGGQGVQLCSKVLANAAVAAGQATPEDAAQEAERQAKRYYKG